MGDTKPELIAAAKWWADQLRHGFVNDNGDGFQSAMISFMKSPAPEAAAIQKFEDSLLKRMNESPDYNGDHWRPDMPMWGGYARTVATDYHPDQLLQQALDDAGIKSNIGTLPVKTVMWIDPGEVRVKGGYSAEIQTIYSSTVTPHA